MSLVGQKVRVTAGQHRGVIGLCVDRTVYGGSTGYLSIIGKKRKIIINEDQVERVEDTEES